MDTLHKKCMAKILILTCGMVVPSLYAIDYPDVYDSQPAPVYYGLAEWQISDKDLTKKIHEEIKAGWFSEGFEQVKVRVDEGRVTLFGSVKKAHDKNYLEERVKEIKGVKGVYNQLEVKEEGKRVD